MNCGFKHVIEKAGEAVGHVSEKFQETNIGEKMKEAGTYVYEKGSELASAAVNKGRELKEDPMVQNITTNTHRGFRSFSENVKNVSAESER